MFSTINQIKEANKAISNYFFSPDTMKFFHSRIVTGVLKGRYFITSEYKDNASEKKYTVRMAKNNGAIETTFEFQAFKTLSQAKKALNTLPAQYMEARELARAQWMEKPIQGMNFTEMASIEPENNKDMKFSFDSFTGACSFIVANYQELDLPFVESLINGDDLLIALNYKHNFSS